MQSHCEFLRAGVLALTLTGTNSSLLVPQDQAVTAGEDGVPLVLGQPAPGAGAPDQPAVREQQFGDLAVCGASESAAVGR